MNPFFDNNRIVKSIWKWKMHIVVVIIIAAVVSIFISSPLVIKPKYKSTARIYPVNITEASEESETEHLLENIQSTDLKFKIIDAFKLDEVYKIKRDDKLYKTYILYEFNQNVTFKKTEFETVEIKVLDIDPKRASAMVDSIIVFNNELIQKQRAQRYLELAQVAKRDLENKSREMDSVFNLINNIRKEYNLVDYFAQSEMATQGLMDAAALRGNIKPSQDMMNSLILKGGELRKWQERLLAYEVEADTFKVRYDLAISKATMKLSYSRIVQKPFPADKKSYPVRWLILFLSVIGAAFISVITVSLIDYIREIKSAE